jgi:hypothetical protein
LQKIFKDTPNGTIPGEALKGNQRAKVKMQNDKIFDISSLIFEIV